MASMGPNSERQRLRIDISPTTMAVMKYRTNKLNEIVAGVCALLNSGGGKLELFIEYANSSTNIAVRDIVRMVEQRVCDMVEITTKTSHIKIKQNQQNIIIDIEGAGKLITMRYNLYLPSESQVVAVRATVPTEEIKEIFQKKIVEDCVSIGSHVKRFVKGENSGLQESNDVQLKNLKASASKCVTVALRIVGKSNKLPSYISAFANHRGGHIYYGIDHTGIVEGEEITEKDKEDIIKKVTKTLNKMVWTPSCQKPRRGEHWDIFFEPVEGTNGKPIPSTYVIVVYVAPCPGGVFTEEPESYHIVKGEVNKTRFQDWLMKVTGKLKNHQQSSPVPSHVSRLQWSSVKNAKIFRTLSEKLLRYRNDEDTSAFKRLSQLAMAHFPDSNAELIVKAEQIVVAYKHYQFNKAELELERFSKLLNSSNDRFIFEARMLLLQSKIERTQDNYEGSYEIIEQGFPIMEQIPVELYTVWFHIEAAMIATIISTKEHDTQRNDSLKEKALNYLELAARYANSFDNASPDLQQKLHICKTFVLLECSNTGEAAPQTNYKHIEAAAKELLSVTESAFKGTGLSHFRRVEYHLAQCDLFRRRSEVSDDDQIPNLKQAFEIALRARDLAKEHHFENLVDYAKKRMADLTEKLVRHAVLTRGKRDTFFGFEY